MGFAAVEPGQELEIGWPLASFRQHVAERRREAGPGGGVRGEGGRFVDGPAYTVHWIGNFVADVEPRGPWLPLYTRDGAA